MRTHTLLFGPAILATNLVALSASADEVAPMPPPLAAPAPAPKVTDGVRFRGAIAASGGGEWGENNPQAPVLHFRLGGYPVFWRTPNGLRRKGLSIGADFRVFLPYDLNVTVTQAMGSIAYEVF